MGAPITPTSDWQRSDIDMIIDVRAPAEFAEDHISGAINLPVLNDAERADIGTIYKQISAFEARRKGAVLVSQNIARHLDTILSDKPADFQPLIYCWRGGQRSRSFATICSEIGWPTHLLEGGYKTYRSEVMRQLEVLPEPLSFRLIAGPTGSAKTALLHSLAACGAQIIDLENLAAHRGSLLGAEPNLSQPSQRLFESKLYAQMLSLSPDSPVYIEAESAKIGAVQLPRMLWQKMCGAPAVTLAVPTNKRIEFLLEDYAHLFSRVAGFDRLITGMEGRYGKTITAKWSASLQQNDWPALAQNLLQDHYDPAYSQSSGRHKRPHIWELAMPDCTPDSLTKAALTILEATRWAATR